jgi:hypothetical protein
MKTNIRLKLDMAGRVQEFLLAHAAEDPAIAQVTARLGELVPRARELARTQRAAQMTEAAAVDQKDELRHAIEDGLASLVGIAKAAAEAHPDLTVHQRMPRRRPNAATLLTTARVAVTEAIASKERLAAYGMTDALLQSLTADLDAYEAAVSRQRNAQAAKVGAGAELAAVTADIMAVARNLDAIHRVRFRKDPELKAAWKSARNVAWPAPEPAEADEERAA